MQNGSWAVMSVQSVFKVFNVSQRCYSLGCCLFRRSNVGFAHGDVEQPRVTRGFGGDGRYTKLPEPIRDHAKPAPDLKLTREVEKVDPYSDKEKNKGRKDFYDLFCDQSYDMRNNVDAPYWVKNASRNELKRILFKRKAVGRQMSTKEVRLMNKRVWFLFKRYNFKTDQAKGPFPK